MATVRKRGKKYQVQVRRKNQTPISRSFHSKADADEWARMMETKADRDDLPTPIKVLGSFKVRDITERYRDEITPKKKSGEGEGYSYK